jgi:hypothetical protein
MSMTAPARVMTLEYAHPQTLGSAAARKAFGWMLVLSILSGLCVAVCFLSFTETILAWVIHSLIFAITIGVGFKSGKALMQMLGADDPGRIARMGLDAVALLGVAGIGVSPWVYFLIHGSSINDAGFGGMLGVAYLLLTLTSWRHVMLYRVLAGICRQVNRYKLAQSLTILGWFKTIYEFLWLGCCSFALVLAVGGKLMGDDPAEFAVYFAVGALVGILGFAFIWIWMIVAHAQLYRLAK